MIRLVNVWSSNSADSHPDPRRFRVLHLSTYALPRVRGIPSPLLCRQLDDHLDSGRKHQEIKLNELQVQCRLWNGVKKEGFCKVNTDQRISKNQIFSNFGFAVMSFPFPNCSMPSRNTAGPLCWARRCAGSFWTSWFTVPWSWKTKGWSFPPPNRWIKSIKFHFTQAIWTHQSSALAIKKFGETESWALKFDVLLMWKHFISGFTCHFC